jgi:serine/threonine protein kinase
MASRPTLPYFAPKTVLPGPLPTLKEIFQAKQLPSAHQAVTGVFRVREHFVVKFGRYVNLQEGENMLFIRQCSNVPVPTVYALFHDEKTNQNFIVQEYISGISLYLAWKDLTDSQKMSIASQIRLKMDELRQIPSPGYYGGIWG